MAALAGEAVLSSQTRHSGKLADDFRNPPSGSGSSQTVWLQRQQQPEKRRQQQPCSYVAASLRGLRARYGY